MLDLKGGAERVELVFSRRGALAQAEETIGELFSVIGQDGADADRAGTLQVPKKAPRVGRGLGLEDANEDPADRTIYRHEEVAAQFSSAILGRYFTSMWR